MNITSVDVYPIMSWRPHLFVTVTADDGSYGVGESGLSWQEKPIAAAIERFSELIVGENPMRTEHLWQLMARASFFPADRINCAAISAIDLALWDLKGKLLGQPVYNLIGGLVRDRIQCYPHNEGEDDPPRLIDDIERTVADGWRFARWGFSGTTAESFDPSDAVRKSVRAIEEVRSHFGPELELCVDVHTRIDLPDALRYCRAVEHVNPYFIEDALRSERPESYRRLRERTSVPLAAGEQWFTKWGFATAIEEELIDYARIDLCLVGGFTEALKIARWAETHHIQIAPHNPLGPVSSAAGAHLTLAAANAGVLEMAKEPGTNLQDVFPQQTPFERGHALPTDQPGWGIAFDAEAASRYPEPGVGYAPMLQRRDGSFTNW